MPISGADFGIKYLDAQPIALVAFIRQRGRTGWRTIPTGISNHNPGFLAFAIHALSHPIGAMHHTHHGTTNAVVMQPVLMFNRPAIEERLAQAAAYLGIGSSFDEFYAYVGELNAALGIPKDLTALGIINPDLDRLTAEALKDPSVGGNPVAMNAENTRALFEACF